MSDDMWRERRDRDDFSEYGSLFDDTEPTENIDEVRGKKPPRRAQGGKESERSASAPATPDLAALDRSADRRGAAARRRATGATTDELDVWSSFAAEAPVWQRRRAGRGPQRRRPAAAGSGDRVDDVGEVDGQRRSARPENPRPRRPRAGPDHDRHRPDGRSARPGRARAAGDRRAAARAPRPGAPAYRPPAKSGPRHADRDRRSACSSRPCSHRRADVPSRGTGGR